MATTRYHSLNSELVGETYSGSRTDYLTDALDSVTSTVSAGASLVNLYTFAPYGSTIARSGSGSDPRFLWAGAKGYRSTTRKNSETYVRARHFGQPEGRWTTSRFTTVSPYDWNIHAMHPGMELVWANDPPIAGGSEVAAARVTRGITTNGVGLSAPDDSTPNCPATNMARQFFATWISVSKAGTTGYNIMALVQVNMFCTLTCNPCCPSTTPDADIVQWIDGYEKFGAKTTPVNHEWDDSQKCDGPTQIDKCHYSLKGVDAPGLGDATRNSASTCVFSKKAMPYTVFPIDIEYHFTTCCGSPSPGQTGTPPCQATVQWGIKILADDRGLSRGNIYAQFTQS